MNRNSRTLLLLLATLITGVTMRADNDTRILAAGPPPLTSDMTNRSARFFEWVLDVQFTPSQMAEYERMQIRDWRDSSKRKSTLDLLKNTEKLDAAAPATRDRIHAELQRSIVEQLRKDTNDADSRWMLAIYDAARPSAAPAPSAPPAANTSARVNGQLTGKWASGSVAMTQYHNAYTGAPAPTSGNRFVYEFLPDGTFKFNGLMQITTYGCTSMIYSESNGTYRTEGDRLYINTTGGKTRSQVCGGAMKENPAKTGETPHTYHFERDSSGNETMVLNGTSGNTRPDYFRREKQ